MSSPQTDYYALMGLNPKASQEEIKKRYRELARRYHPDVNHNPDAAHKIKTINEAYHVLGDPDRRATYEANRIFQMPTGRQASSTPSPATPASPSASARQGASASAETSGPRSFRATPTTPPPSGRRSGEADFDGFGRVVKEAARRATAETAGNPTRRTAAQRQSEEAALHVKQMVSEAQLEYINRRYIQAEKLCRQVIKLDSHNALAYELLGDCARKLGDTEAAVQAYSYAIQMNPRNKNVQVNLDRLTGSHSKPASTGRPTMARSTQVPLRERLGRDVIVNGAGGLSIAALLLLFGLVYLFPGSAWIADLSPNLLGALALCGLLSGFLLALYGGMRPQSRELAIRSDWHSPMPLNVVLAVLALAWFGVSLIAYVTVAVTQNRVSASVLRAYALTLFLSVLFVLIYHPLNTPEHGDFSMITALFAGNILLPTILAGWNMGDKLRLGDFAS